MAPTGAYGKASEGRERSEAEKVLPRPHNRPSMGGRAGQAGFGGREEGAGKVNRTANRRAMKVLEGLWKALEIPGPPPLELAEFLTRRRKSVVKVRPHYGKETEVTMFFPIASFRLPTPLPTFPPVRLTGSASGGVEVKVKDIFAREGKVFFSGRHLGKVTENREAVKVLRPLFAALGLEDLEGALEALSGLGEGEARREGEYLLARQRGKEGRFILRRGSLLGDFALDKAFVLGEKVKLFFPGDVELTLEVGGFMEGLVHLVGLEVRWGEEKARFGAGVKWAEARANRDDPAGELVRKRVARGLRELDLPLSPRMRALLKALARQKKPLQALRREGFLRRVLLDALSRI